MWYKYNTVRGLRDRQNPQPNPTQPKQRDSCYSLENRSQETSSFWASGSESRKFRPDLAVMSMGTLYVLQTLDVIEWAGF